MMIEQLLFDIHRTIALRGKVIEKMAAAYLIHVDPESGYGDPDGMAQYNAHVGAIIESFGGAYHLRHKKSRVLEGDWSPDFITLIEFPSMIKLLEFYESEEYRPWLDVRKNAGAGRIVVFEGGAPDYPSG
jgi:uncharacterized protein (DUF1330 family)